MNCVLITLTYPFGDGDPFLKDELPIIAKEFEHIYIIPLNRAEGQSDVLPHNAELLASDSKCIWPTIKALISFKKIIQEIHYGRRQGYSGLLRMIYRVLMYEIYYNSYIGLLDKFAVDKCVFYSYWLSETAYLIARFKERHIKALCISRAHGYDCFKERGYNPFRREIAENIDYIYSISEKGRKDLEKNLVCQSRKRHEPVIRVSHLGVATSAYLNPPQEEPSKFRIVTCSNVIRLKRLDLMANAFQLIKCNDVELEWVHFGDGELLDMIKKYVSGLNLPRNKHVIFKGKTDHEMILEYYKTTHVDLFVNCSDTEGIPVSIMEAMEYGIPCMGRDVGGISELIDDKINGFLLPTKIEPQTIAQMIENLMKNRIGEEMRISAKKKIRSEFSSDMNYQKFAQELINSY